MRGENDESGVIYWYLIQDQACKRIGAVNTRTQHFLLKLEHFKIDRAAFKNNIMSGFLSFKLLKVKVKEDLYQTYVFICV